MTKQKLNTLFVTVFGVGFSPKVPGTFGTLATIPIWFLVSKFHIIYYMFFVFALVIAGIFASQYYESYTHKHDSKEIVIDEVAGFLITMMWLPVTWQSVVIGFVLFRFFDIVKPGPIKMLDQKVKGGVGVMIDDVAAGIVCNLILQIVYNQTDRKSVV